MALQRCTGSKNLGNDNPSIRQSYWPVFINGRKLHSNLRNTLYEEIYRNKMAKHWEKRDRMGQERSMRVNWEACEAAMKRLKIVNIAIGLLSTPKECAESESG
jgi:hypothetical protein